MALRVVLIDDDPRFRAKASRTLVSEGAQVVAELSDGAGAVEAAATWEPDVVLVDIRMPGVDGLEAARRLRDTQHGPIVILISTSGLHEGQQLAKGIADGYLPKDELSLPAILAIAAPGP